MDLTYLDFARWHSRLNHKQYCDRNPKKPNEFRAMFVQFDSISGRPRFRYETNFVVGDPSSYIPEILPLLKSRILIGNWGNMMM